MASASRHDGPAAVDAAPTSSGAQRHRGHHGRKWLNWTLALLTAPAAVLLVLFGMAAVMSTAACTGEPCPESGPNGVWFTVCFYGAPVVSALTILVSFFTAGHRRGFLVPLGAWVLLAVDLGMLALIFRH